jgi:putative ABC transport system permease protein
MRVVRQLLTESLILSAAGGMLGFILAYVSLDLFIALAPANLPRLGETTIDNSVLAFTLAISLLTGLIFGLFPAFQSLRTNLNDKLKETGRGASAGLERNRMRQILVVSEVALTLVIVIGAGLMLQTLQRLQAVDPGFNPENVLTVRMNLPDAKYENSQKQQAFIRTLLERVSGLPGVTSAATTSFLPLSGSNFSISFKITHRPEPEPGKEPSAQLRFVSNGYFETMQIPVVQGRTFTPQDTATAPPVAIINESLARQFFPGEDPVGKVIDPGYQGRNDPNTLFQIVGVVRDIKHFNLRVEPRAEYYLPVEQLAYSGLTLVVRTANDPASLSAALRREVNSLDRDLAVFSVFTMEQVLGTSISDARLNTALLGTFGFIALLLASIGIYGVMSYAVTQRTHEIGIRMALGANRPEVLGMVLRQGLRLAAIGVTLGIMGALVLTSYMQNMVFQVSLTDPPTFIAVSMLLAAVALLASYIPARRATRVDPIIALRYE